MRPTRRNWKGQAHSGCLIAAVVMSVCAGARAQQVGSIRGVVSDGDFDLPLANAEVIVTGRSEKAVTSKQGNYSVANLPPGRYTLIFAKPGYVRVIKPDVVVSAGRLSDLDITMVGDFTDMEEYVVEDVLLLGGSAEANLLQLRFESPAVMDAVGAELMSKAGASDAASALRLVAGATVQDGKSAVIRGLPDRYVSSQINGLRLPTADEDKRAVELDQFPRQVIESLQVRKTFTPDQQGDASGGAVNIVLKGVPEDSFFLKWSGQVGRNDEVGGSGDFLSYEGGGLHFDGRSHGNRAVQTGNIGRNWDGAVGAREQEAPQDYKFSGAFGGKFEIADGVRVGGLVSVFYERDSSMRRNGIDDSYWVDQPGQPMTPRVAGDPGGGDFQTALFDVTRGSQSVQWGVLGTVGVESDNHSVNLAYLQTQSAEDIATIAEDTRGKSFFFPGYDPENLNSNGFFEFDAAPYLRLQTLEYTERSTQVLQLAGRHTFESRGGMAPEIDWAVAQSAAGSYQPDKRQFGSRWVPGFDLFGFTSPPTYAPYKPAANFTLGSLQRIYQKIEEESDQGMFNIKLPFEVWDGDQGYVKFGGFHDQVDRRFNQDTFSNFNDNEIFNGGWEVPWSVNFPFESHPITESTFDVDYAARQRIAATYVMLDLPVVPTFNLVGGVRFESTHIRVNNDAEPDATWFPPGSLNVDPLTPGAADVSFDKDEVLPSIGLIWRPGGGVTLRASYAETVARQTFKELTPILQQEFLGGPIFIGNPELEMSSIKNYDLRCDWAPYDGGLISASYFKKDIRGPIEYVQRVATFDFTSPVNYPKGQLSGFELETRQDLGQFWSPFEGLSVGANATFIDSVVQLSDEEIAQFADPGVSAPQTERDMTNAPEHLYNMFLTWDLALTGTQIGLFYTQQGDTLVAGAGVSETRFLVPDVYLVENDRLNLSISQRLNETTVLRFQANNLTDPDMKTVYRSQYIGQDITRRRHNNGVDFSLSFSGEIRF